MQTAPIKVTVNHQPYTVTTVQNGTLTEYRIETGCDYMFTLIQVNGNWQIKEKDVKPFDEELICKIGQEIELSE